MPGLTASIPLLQQTAAGGAPVASQEATASDSIGVSYRLAVVRAQIAQLSQTIGAGGTTDALRGIVMRERLRIALSQVTNQSVQISAADTLRLASALLPAVPASLNDEVAIELTTQAALSLRIIEALQLAPVVAPALLYNHSVSDTLRVASTLAKFLGGDVIDEVTVAPLMSGSVGKGGQLSDGIGIAASLTPQLVMRVTAADTIDLDDVDALQMLFAPTLADGIEISAAYISPGNSVVTWAMNTRTAAVTEYSDYAFNSFAKLGDRYIGATDEGLYELTGDTDDGDTIIAQIKSGFAQWAGSRFTMFKAAYLGVRGEGDYVLKITTGEGRSYSYAVSSRDMRTTKVNIGKGIRTRYFAFELISEGQDFDLDTVEFVPLVAERRI